MTVFEAELRRRVRGEVAFDPGSRALYSTAACIYRVPPVGVVAPLDADDVLAAVALCRAHSIPITPRGAGSGLAGQALGDGLVLDFTVHMNRILDIVEGDATRDGGRGTGDAGPVPRAACRVPPAACHLPTAYAWVQPGLICDQLNAALAPRGLWFPPDPSSSAYCSLGGMIANNSAGSHSVKYGSVIDWVEELDVVLADGTSARLGPYALDGPPWQRLVAQETREAQLHRDLRLILERHPDLIRDHQPRTTKNSAGYRLERVIENGALNLSKLICGSEGTLAIVLAAKLRLAPLPRARREALLHFPDLAAAGRATLEILPFGPSAIELHERHAVDVIRAGRPELADLLPRPGESQLHVEFDAASEEEARDALARMRAKVCGELNLASRCIEPASADEARRLWAIRKATLPLLYNQPGPKRIVSFIEDVTVPPGQIPAFIERLQATLDRHGLQAAIYGHAAQGNFHVRPLLDLHDPAEAAKMRAVADEVFDLTIALGGTTSGEHGDGLARTEYLARLYGPLHHLFGAVKRTFDPENLLNPGKKVPDPRRGCSLTSHLRFDGAVLPVAESSPSPRSRAGVATRGWWHRPLACGPQAGRLCHQPPVPTPFRKKDAIEDRPLLCWGAGGPAAEAERCHGCATCRAPILGGASVPRDRMCPVFKALGTEESSPRAKANLLREIAAGRLTGDEAARALARLSDLCLLCESCKADCPSKINVPKLILEARARLATEGRRTRGQWLFTRLDALARLARPIAPIANAANRLRPARWLIEKLAGLDHRAPLPPLARRSLRRRIADCGLRIADLRPGLPSSVRQSEIRNPKSEIVYLPDTFAEVSDPTIGEALIRLLAAAGIKTLIPPLEGCGILAMCYGNIAAARKTIRHNIEALSAKPGIVILTTEPTAYLCLREAYADFVPDDAAREAAARTHDALDYLLALRNDGRLKLDLRPVGRTLAYHLPCHARAAGIGGAALKLLAEIPKLRIVPLNEGCCGLAGSAGMRRDTYGLSMRIGAPLFEKIRAEGIDGSVTECSACRLQLHHGAGKPSYHPLHLLAHSAFGTPLPSVASAR
ncbi:MAG: FAD-binding protein [Planctomycetes bacterium]|nr:FAD-binding protein [Planctomycetota bacterium]